MEVTTQPTGIPERDSSRLTLYASGIAYRRMADNIYVCVWVIVIHGPG